MRSYKSLRRAFIFLVLCYDNFSGCYAQILKLNEDDETFTTTPSDLTEEIGNSSTIMEKRYSAATEMCHVYSDLIYTYESIPALFSTKKYNKIMDCKDIKALIVGGTMAERKEFPHMALLGYNEKVERNAWGCGGSLVSNRWILTAAHCEKIGDSHYALWARLGDLDYLSNDDDARAENYRIVQRVIHPNYKPPSVYHDIALFRLERDVQFSAYVRPVCLNADRSWTTPTAIATGWGQVGYAKSTSSKLLKVQLNVVPADQCNGSYASSIGTNLTRGIESDSQICAGYLAGGKDACGGDSGGPLQVTHPNYTCMYTQIGITSFGKFCGKKNTPGVYTRVSNYILWIEQMVWPKRD